MDASCKIQRSIHDVRLTYKYVSRILGTYQNMAALRRLFFFAVVRQMLVVSLLIFDCFFRY